MCPRKERQTVDCGPQSLGGSGLVMPEEWPGKKLIWEPRSHANLGANKNGFGEQGFMWSCGELGCVLAPLIVSASGPWANEVWVGKMFY